MEQHFNKIQCFSDNTELSIISYQNNAISKYTKKWIIDITRLLNKNVRYVRLIIYKIDYNLYAIKSELYNSDYTFLNSEYYTTNVFDVNYIEYKILVNEFGEIE